MTLRSLRIQRYLITGLLTFIPLWVTWLVFKFIFGLLAGVGAPLVAALLGVASPPLREALGHAWLLPLLALLATLLSLYTLGFLASRVLGARILGGFDRVMERIPMVHTIYGGAKKLMSVLSTKPSGTQRVVLIDFPAPPLKAVGFVTRTFRDEQGRELAAVYVPTTPNPTGGYLEVVPTERLTATTWSVDQAMAFILSAGAVVPDSMPAPTEPPAG